MTDSPSSVERACAWLGRVSAWTVPVLVLGVCASVVLAQMRANTLLAWGVELPLFGSSLTAGGLNDLQWHLFAVMVMLGGVYALHDNAHVSVDFLSSRFPPRVRAALTLAGDLLLLLPFALVMTWFSWQYMASAYSTGEGSSYGGLSHRWVIKAVMPLGFGLLSLFAAARALRLALALLRLRG